MQGWQVVCTLQMIVCTLQRLMQDCTSLLQLCKVATTLLQGCRNLEISIWELTLKSLISGNRVHTCI